MASQPARGLILGNHTNQEAHGVLWFGARGSVATAVSIVVDDGDGAVWA